MDMVLADVTGDLHFNYLINVFQPWFCLSAVFNTMYLLFLKLDLSLISRTSFPLVVFNSPQPASFCQTWHCALWYLDPDLPSSSPQWMTSPAAQIWKSLPSGGLSESLLCLMPHIQMVTILTEVGPSLHALSLLWSGYILFKLSHCWDFNWSCCLKSCFLPPHSLKCKKRDSSRKKILVLCLGLPIDFKFKSKSLEYKTLWDLDIPCH